MSVTTNEDRLVDPSLVDDYRTLRGSNGSNRDIPTVCRDRRAGHERCVI